MRARWQGQREWNKHEESWYEQISYSCVYYAMTLWWSVLCINSRLMCTRFLSQVFFSRLASKFSDALSNFVLFACYALTFCGKHTKQLDILYVLPSRTFRVAATWSRISYELRTKKLKTKIEKHMENQCREIGKYYDVISGSVSKKNLLI